MFLDVATLGTSTRVTLDTTRAKDNTFSLPRCSPGDRGIIRGQRSWEGGPCSLQIGGMVIKCLLAGEFSRGESIAI